ncbi:acetylornithine transaminase [Alkalilimnicola sp. S0819]|uniref:acetylornithine transaminase n=1 Tax=Alkalilimnicola sp. S0819 TaxID=2613922 RepID=UPI001261628D|nr:acetylornithine transaminase [Alkalilimnicola sp. S0819]KAB7623186.1 acetylornithine transaminase [Alkalilimnicola sp. S0819]MPQ17032.1 acetylornithine transaminase [Alkalilimnicola sp. S0819]
MSDYLMPTYARLPVAFVRGEGCWLWDADGKRYLDGLSGIAVSGLGHSHPRLVAALQDQVGQLLHTSNLYRVPLQEQLAERLCGLAGMERAFFCNSGAEANEAAIKIARLHAHQRGNQSPVILTTERSFHGRTLGTLSATGNTKAREGFGPHMPGFTQVPYNDLQAVEAAGDADPNICAVLVEPVQGEGGVTPAREGYLAGLRALCDRRGWLLMFDEVQTGIARTGEWFGFQHETAQPDVLTLAKGLGSGVPVGACLARGSAAETFGPGSHGSTFGGNPLACRAALATLETISDKALVQRAASLGAGLRERFEAALAGRPILREIRGRGLMLGLVLDRPCTELVRRALDRGLLINVTAESVVRLLPPLVMSDAEADELADRLIELINEFAANNA